MKTIHNSYGIIPVYKKDGDYYILCVKNHKSGDWGLPKGTPEGDEKPLETAKRELREETGIEDIEIISGKILKRNMTLNKAVSFIIKRILIILVLLRKC